MPSEAPRYKSIAELLDAIVSGKTTVRAVTEGYLQNISDLNGQLNAVTVTNDRALEDADRLDRLSREDRGPLCGLPILIKDQIETAGIKTSYGSAACKDYVPDVDATLIRKLREAGAVILGKTTMCDWAAGYSSLSSLSGTTQHPIDSSRDPGGSSAGSGTAVAADLALAAIGGDTGGSIRLPSSFCGLVGLRPTPGRISRDGMSSLLSVQDTPGPMTKNVEDAARLMDVLVGFDERDESTSINHFTGRTTMSTQFTDAIKQPFLEGKRLGVLREVFGNHRGINTVLEKTLADLKNAGVELIEVSVPDLQHFRDTTSMYFLRSKTDINDFMKSRKGLAHLNIVDLHASGTYHRGLKTIDLLVKGPSDYLQSPHFGKAIGEQLRFQRVMGSVFAKHDLDAMIYPTSQLLAPKTQDLLDLERIEPPNTVIGSQLLWTALSVPIGKATDDYYPDDPELPVGLEVLGVPLSEERILNIAAGIESLRAKT